MADDHFPELVKQPDNACWPLLEDKMRVHEENRRRLGLNRIGEVETAERQLGDAARSMGNAIGWMAKASPEQATGLLDAFDLINRGFTNAIAYCERRITAEQMAAESTAILAEVERRSEEARWARIRREGEVFAAAEAAKNARRGLHFVKGD